MHTDSSRVSFPSSSNGGSTFRKVSALNVHLDQAIPALDSVGLKGTFYLTGYFAGLDQRAGEWTVAAQNGHELANHTLFHPCDGQRPGRDFVNVNYDLSRYTVERITDEILMTNRLLNALDGKTARTFAYPCGDTHAGDNSYVANLKDHFIAARGVSSKLENIDSVDLFDIGSYMINEQSGSDLIRLVDQAMESNSLLVFLFHGVGGEHNLNVSLEAHRELLHYLKQHEDEIWIAPMLEVAEFIREQNR